MCKALTCSRLARHASRLVVVVAVVAAYGYTVVVVVVVVFARDAARRRLAQGLGQICGPVMHLSPVARPIALHSGRPAGSAGHVSGSGTSCGHEPSVGA